MFGSKAREIATAPIIAVIFFVAATAPQPAFAAARSQDFTFAYRQSDLHDVVALRALATRLSSEAMRYCRTTAPDGRSPVTQLGCRRSVVQAVRARIAERVAPQLRSALG